MTASAIFENLEAGASIDDIMEWFDGLIASIFQSLSHKPSAPAPMRYPSSNNAARAVADSTLDLGPWILE
jgi:hypothetical protein